MKIEPFKIKVTPEQSKQVQEVLFREGYSWYLESKATGKLDSEYLLFHQSAILGETKPTLCTVDVITWRYFGVQELSFNEFMDKYFLPEKWFVLYSNREEFDIINKHFKKYWEFACEADRYGYATGDCSNNWVSYNSASKLLGLGYTQLTFNQFKNYVMKEKVPENLKFFVNYSSLFTEDLYNKLMEWCKNNSLGKPRDFNDTYEGLKRHRYFVFNNWGLNIRNKPSIEEIKNERGYGVDNNPQGCDFKYSIEDVKKLINYKTMQDKQIIGYKVKPQFIEAYKRLAGDSELQDIWCEPIYRKDEFKIGDWCYITDAQNSRLQAGKVYKINAVEVTSYGIRYHFDLDGRNNRSNSCWLPVDAFRKATPKEIKKAEVVEMPFGDEMMIVTGNSIKDRGGNVLSYGDMCEIFESLTRDLPYFEQYRLEIDKNSTIHLGCKKGTLLQIIGIVNKMNELRNED